MLTRGFRLFFCCALLILFRISCRRRLQGLGRCKHFHSGSDLDVHNKRFYPYALRHLLSSAAFCGRISYFAKYVNRKFEILKTFHVTKYKISHANLDFASLHLGRGLRPIQLKTKTDFHVLTRGFRLCFCCAWLILFRISCRRRLQGLGRCKHFHSGSDQDVHNKSECPDVLYAVSQDLPALR